MTRSFEEIVAELKRHDELLELHGKELKSLRATLGAIGARWGMLAEDAFRKGMEGIIRDIYPEGEVRRWEYYDKDGYVFGFPSIVDVDVVLRDRKHILVEIKANVSKADVFAFYKKAELYAKINKVKPELVVLTPFIDRDAEEACIKFKIKVYKP